MDLVRLCTNICLQFRTTKLTQQRTSLLEHMVFRGQWWFWLFHCGCVRHQHIRKWSVFDRTNLTKITKQNDTVLWLNRRGISTNTQSLVSGFFGFRLFWFFVLPVRVLYSILLLVGSLPCRNPKCATRKNVPAIYIHDMWVTRSRASSQACKCSCGKGD